MGEVEWWRDNQRSGRMREVREVNAKGEDVRGETLGYRGGEGARGNTR